MDGLHVVIAQDEGKGSQLEHDAGKKIGACSPDA